MLIHKIQEIILKNKSFIGSISVGLFIWIIAFMCLPIHTKPLSFETISFLFLSICSLILGYFSFNFKKKTEKKKPFELEQFFMHVLVVILVTFLLRYVDLFYFRDLSYEHPFYKNKSLTAYNARQAPFLLTLFSTLRVLYFLPLLYLISSKSKNKTYWFFSILLIGINSAETFLFGTRKPLFYLAIIVCLTLINTYGIKVFFLRKNIIFSVLIGFFLAGFSYVILSKRINQNYDNTNSLLNVTQSRYNDFVKINETKLNELYSTPKSLNTKVQILLIHTGQYIVHGVYELDYIINKGLPRANGIYSFNPIYKFLNRVGLANDVNLEIYHPREYVYVTFFGSLFIDFGWVSIIIVFIFGIFQKYIYQLARLNPTAKIFWILLLSINLTTPIFNLASGTGLYVLIFMSLILKLTLKQRKVT